MYWHPHYSTVTKAPLHELSRNMMITNPGSWFSHHAPGLLSVIILCSCDHVPLLLQIPEPHFSKTMSDQTGENKAMIGRPEIGWEGANMIAIPLPQSIFSLERVKERASWHTGFWPGLGAEKWVTEARAQAFSPDLAAFFASFSHFNSISGY